MKKSLVSMSAAVAIAATLVGCGGAEPKPQKEEADFRCHKENVLAPEWTCKPKVEGAYAALGVAAKSAAGIGHMRRVALMNGRSELAQQIKTDIKDKVEGFTRTTGVGDSETVDMVSTSVTKQVARVALAGSEDVDSWEAPSGALYMLVMIPKKAVNKAVQDAVKTSFKNDNALWQQFQSQKALESLDNEFPTE